MFFLRKSFLLFTLCFSLLVRVSYAQTVKETGTDSTQKPVVIKKKDKGLKPNYVALMSIVPGAGQVYNGQWWKAPIIYGGLGALGYFVYANNQEYLGYKNAYITRVHPELNPNNEPSKFDVYDVRNPINQPKYNDANTILYLRENAKRNRDLTVIATVATFAANMIDAYVYAHLRRFDVSDDLTLQVNPAHIVWVNNTAFYSTSLKFTF
ncbi:MAG: DUF5683 domain-containing protein [Bacteroidetes bacterium]|nr:DUF5683 domain-containing protein [Bacteroidota bacterium]